MLPKLKTVVLFLCFNICVEKALCKINSNPGRAELIEEEEQDVEIDKRILSTTPTRLDRKDNTGKMYPSRSHELTLASSSPIRKSTTLRNPFLKNERHRTTLSISNEIKKQKKRLKMFLEEKDRLQKLIAELEKHKREETDTEIMAVGKFNEIDVVPNAHSLPDNFSADNEILEKRDAQDPKAHRHDLHRSPAIMSMARLATRMTTIEFGGTRTPFGLTCKPETDKSRNVMYELRVYGPSLEAQGHIHCQLNSTEGISKIGIQVVTFMGFFLGRLIEFTTKSTAGYKCFTIPETINVAKSAEVFTLNKHGNVTESPTVAAFEFGSPINEYHFGWQYGPTEVPEAFVGIQFQSFVVYSSDPKNCYFQRSRTFMPPEYPEKVNQIGKLENDDRDCHIGKGNIVEFADMLDELVPLNMEYFKEIIARRKSYRRHPEFCPTVNVFGVPGCTVSITPDYTDNFLLFQAIESNSKGWITVGISVNEASTSFDRVIVQAISRTGFIIGNWFAFDMLSCNPAAKPTVKYIETPAHGAMAMMAKNPTVVELVFPAMVKNYQLYWTYSPKESAEVSQGIQFHAFLHSTRAACYEVVHSNPMIFPIISAVSVDTLEFTCLTPTAMSVPDPAQEVEILYLNDKYKSDCRSFGDKKVVIAPIVPGITIPPTLRTPRPQPSRPTTNAAIVIPGGGGRNSNSTRRPDGGEIEPGGNITLPNLENMTTTTNTRKNVRAFHDECGKSKGCFGFPNGCIPTASCELAMSYKEQNQNCLMEVRGRSRKYLAVGISRDMIMDQDYVVECVREDLGVRVYSAFNDLGRRHVRRNNHSSLSFLGGSYANSILYCQFELVRVTKFLSLTFDLADEAYHILLARGETGRDTAFGRIDYHSLAVASPDKHVLISQFGKSGHQMTGQRIHSCILVIVWFFLVPISAFMVRYFKETCVDTFIFKYSVWFATHTFLMLLSLSFMIAGSIAIIISTNSFFGGTVNKWYFHNVAGVVLLSIMFIQVTGGTVMYFTSKRLKIIHQLHANIGHFEYLLGMIIAYDSTELDGGLPCAAEGVIIAYVVLYFLIHIIMSYQVCYIDFLQGEPTSRLYRPVPLRGARIGETEHEAPGGIVRKTVLVIFLCVTVITTIALISMYLTDLPDCQEERRLEGVRRAQDAEARRSAMADEGLEEDVPGGP